MTGVFMLAGLVAGLFARTPGQVIVYAAILLGVLLVWLAVITVIVSSGGRGDIAGLLGYVTMDFIIKAAAIALAVLLGYGLRRLVSRKQE